VKVTTHSERIMRNTRFFIIFFEVACGAMLIAALADKAFDLGWGNSWKDIVILFGIMAWGGVVYFFSRMIFKFIGSGL